MKMETKKILLLTTLVTLLPILVGIFYWNQLPDVIATHFDSQGNPNGWSSKAFAVLGIPAVLAVVNVACTVFTETDPRRHKYPEKMMKIVYWICPVISWLIAVVTISYSLGADFFVMPQFASVFLGFLFVIIGNYLPKVKQNYYLGIKLPWTYSDEDNWNKTHRVGGKVWVIGGIALLLNGLLRVPHLEFLILAAMLLIPVIYSYLYSKRKQ